MRVFSLPPVPVSTLMCARASSWLWSGEGWLRPVITAAWTTRWRTRGHSGRCQPALGSVILQPPGSQLLHSVIWSSLMLVYEISLCDACMRLFQLFRFNCWFPLSSKKKFEVLLILYICGFNSRSIKLLKDDLTWAALCLTFTTFSRGGPYLIPF